MTHGFGVDQDGCFVEDVRDVTPWRRRSPFLRELETTVERWFDAGPVRREVRLLGGGVLPSLLAMVWLAATLAYVQPGSPPGLGLVVVAPFGVLGWRLLLGLRAGGRLVADGVSIRFAGRRWPRERTELRVEGDRLWLVCGADEVLLRGAHLEWFAEQLRAHPARALGSEDDRPSELVALHARMRE